MSKGIVKAIFFAIMACAAAFVVAAVVGVVHERAENERQVRLLLDSATAMRQRAKATNAALDARFAAIDIERYMAPTAIASSSGLAAGRAELASYRALLVERDRLAADQQHQAHDLIASLPAGQVREQALQGAASTAGRNHERLAALSSAQNANADAVQAVFDWVDVHHAVVHARDGKLLVDGQRPLDELNALNGRVTETGRTVTEAIAAVKAAQAQSAQTLEQARSSLGP